jgi:hypothetical protein
MLDLDVVAKKFKDSLAGLTSDVNLEPLLAGIKELASLFDSSTVSGRVLKTMITDFGNLTSKVFAALVPVVKDFVLEFEIQLLKFGTSALKAAIWLRDTLGIDVSKLGEKLKDTTVGIDAARVAFALMAGAAVSLAATVAVVVAVADGTYIAWKKMTGAVVDAYNFIKGLSWSDLGKSIVDGMVAGIENGTKRVIDAVKNIGSAARDGVKDALGIHSPSEVFKQLGQQSGEGFRVGLDDSAPRIQASASQVIDPAKLGAKAGAGAAGGGGGIVVNLGGIELVVPHARDGAEVREALDQPSFRAMLTRTLRETLASAGVQTFTPRAQVT